MASQQFWCLSFMLTWIFVFFLPSLCSDMDAPKITLESTVFVAVANEIVRIEYKLKPTNQSGKCMVCYDQDNNTMYYHDIPSTDLEEFNGTVELKNASSGEYYCKYDTAKVYLFLRVRDWGYKEATMWDYTECVVAFFTGVLLIFSVVGTAYVVRGHWKERTAEGGNNDRKPMQNREERMEEELNEDHVAEITASSTSFYASLEPRPRSIYDVLDISVANGEPDQSKAVPKTKKTPKTVVQTTQQQDEGVFQSVYENF